MQKEMPQLVRDCESAVAISVHGLDVNRLLYADAVFKRIHFGFAVWHFARIDNFISEPGKSFSVFLMGLTLRSWFPQSSALRCLLMFLVLV